MSYVVKNIDGKYKIYNKNQNMFINMECTEEQARALTRKMNLGCGFGDWVPEFFNTPFPVVYK